MVKIGVPTIDKLFHADLRPNPKPAQKGSVVTMSMNEADTRYHLINPQLRAKWMNAGRSNVINDHDPMTFDPRGK